MKTCPECGTQMPLVAMECPECGLDMEGIVFYKSAMPDMDDNANHHEKVLTAKARKALSDDQFLYITPDGKRMFPVHDKAHVQNAMSRIPQSNLPAEVKARLLAKARAMAKKMGMDVSDTLETNESTIVQESALIVDSILTIPTITETIENGVPVRRGRLLVSVADRENRNRRVYPESVWRREAARANESAAQGLLTGQAEHPEGRPELLNTILKYTGMSYDKGTKQVYAEFNVIPTAKGKDFSEIAAAGVAIGVSTRGSGHVALEKRGGREVKIIQDDYRLEGIDVMLFGEQSETAARLAQFESVELQPPPETPPEPHMPDKLETIVALREAYPDLVAEVVAADNAALSAQLAEKEQARAALESKLTEADAAKASVDAEAQALKEQNASLTEKLASTETQLASAETQLAEAAQKLSEATALAEAAVSRKDALLHLIEVAPAQKHAAWLTVDLLKDAPSVAAVDEGLPAAAKRAALLIETTLVAGQGVMVAKPDDDSTPPPDTASEDPYPTVRSMATGIRIPAKR